MGIGFVDDGSKDIKHPDDGHKKFDSIKLAVSYLTKCGWKVSDKSMYRHISNGWIGPKPWSIIELDTYAGMYLKRQNGQPAKTASVKSKAPTENKGPQIFEKRPADEKLEWQAKHWEIKTKILRGEYVERSIHERALAMRAARLKSDGENDFRNNASEAIRLVDGDMNRLPDLIDWLLNLLETWLHRYSEDIEFDLPETTDMRRLEQIEAQSG